MVINFECRQCGFLFDCNVGTVTLPENAYRPHFEKEIICTNCGQRSMDEVLLTELGQSQLTQATLGFEADDLFDDEDDELNGFGLHEGECQGCDAFTRLNDLGLCEDCEGKLERDLVRQRDWAYSAMAFGCPESKREDLRKEIIAKYGEKMELIAPKKKSPKQRKRKKRKGRRKTSGSRR